MSHRTYDELWKIVVDHNKAVLGSDPGWFMESYYEMTRRTMDAGLITEAEVHQIRQHQGEDRYFHARND